MPYETTSVDTVESPLPDDADADLYMLKDALDTAELGFSVYTLEPGAEGMEHDHTEDDQEEVYYVVEGGVDVDFGVETVALEEGEAIRIDADEQRQVRNRDHYSKLVLAGAPR